MGVGDDPRYQNGPCFDPFPFPDCSEEQRERIRRIAEKLDGHRKTRQAERATITLTAMYNVLEKLRSKVDLDAKERTVCEHGLVSVLLALHEELDAAVIEAYGWAHSITDAEILHNVVALNAQRAAEERLGTVRWLRADYQSQATMKKSVAKETAVAAMQMELPWPDEFHQQVASIRDLLTAQASPFTANDIAAIYPGATPRTVIPALKTLEALGIVVAFDADRGRFWKGIARATGERIAQDNPARASSRPPVANAR